MSESERVAARIHERLAGDDPSFRRELSELLVDGLLARRLCDALDLEAVRDVVVSGLTEPNLRRLIEQHVAAGVARYAQAIRTRDVQVGALVDPVAHRKLHALARSLRLPPGRWTKNAVDPLLVRRLLRPVWTQVLIGFAKRLPLPLAAAPAGAASGRSALTGRLARSVQEQAEKLIDRGRSAMGGLGAEFERRLAAAAQDFSDTAAQAFRSALIERLESEEGRGLVGQILAGFTDHLLGTQLADLQLDVDALPVAACLDLVPDLVGHASQTEFVRDIVACELQAWLALEGERTLGSLLDELDMRERVRTLVVQHVDRHTASVVGSPQFAAWLSRLVLPSEP